MATERTPRTGSARARKPKRKAKAPPKKRGRGAGKPKDWAAGFLEAFEEQGTVKGACAKAGVGRTTVYQRRAADPVFAEAWDRIEEETTESMEREAYRRAVEGTERPVYQGGEQVGSIREYSDSLLTFMLKARRPDVYRERVEHSGSIDRPASAEQRRIDEMDEAGLSAFLVGVDAGAKRERARSRSKA